MKIVMRYCDANDLLDLKLEDVLKRDLPFDLNILPNSFPPLTELKLWVYPEDKKQNPNECTLFQAAGRV